MKHNGGLNIDPALHLAVQQGAHLVTEAPMMGKFCSRVPALLPDWHVASILEGTRLSNGNCRGHYAGKKQLAAVCAHVNLKEAFFY